MKQSFIDTLVGMSVADAEKTVYLEGFEFLTLMKDEAVALVAWPKTVLMWQVDGKVTFAQAGDPLELEKE